MVSALIEVENIIATPNYYFILKKYPAEKKKKNFFLFPSFFFFLHSLSRFSLENKWKQLLSRK